MRGAASPKAPHGAGAAVAERSASESLRGDAETRAQDEFAGSESGGSAGRVGSVKPTSEVGMKTGLVGGLSLASLSW